jgi:hypothetical protein
MIVNVECRGTSPLLMNRMSADVLEGLRTGVRPPKAAKTGTVRTPRQECEQKVYEAEGVPVIPAQNLMSALIAAGVWVRLDGKRQVSTAKATMLPAFLTLLDTVLPVHVPGTKKAAKWEASVMQGKNPNGGEAVAICRPRFDAWAFSARIDVDTAEIGMNAIRDLWDKAGRRVGLCDFRPQHKGIFGQFRVECWEQEKEVIAAE